MRAVRASGRELVACACGAYLNTEALLVAVRRERRDPQLELRVALQRDHLGLADEERLARRELLDELAVLVEELGAQRQLGVAPDPAPRVEHADLEREVPQVGDHHLLLGVAVRLRHVVDPVDDVVEDLQVAPRPGQLRRRHDPARRERRRRERVAHPGAAEHAERLQLGVAVRRERGRARRRRVGVAVERRVGEGG